MTAAAGQCWKCGAAWDRPLRDIKRSDRCRACEADLYCCRMCKSYAPELHRRCREDRAEPPRDAEAANFCDWFDPNPAAFGGGGDDEAAAARAALDDLFGK